MKTTGLVLSVLLGQAQGGVKWHDPANHHVQFVTVQEGVQLEVLDWGGSGRPIVLLAGSGNTAHVFDDFAPRLTVRRQSRLRHHAEGLRRFQSTRFRLRRSAAG